MTKEEKILLIVRNSDFTYEELEKLPMSSIDSIYRAHVLEKMEDRSDIVTNKVEKRDILILSSFVFVVMLIYNFGIKQMEFGDDAFFLKQFTHDFQSNYYEF